VRGFLHLGGSPEANTARHGIVILIIDGSIAVTGGSLAPAQVCTVLILMVPEGDLVTYRSGALFDLMGVMAKSEIGAQANLFSQTRKV